MLIDVGYYVRVCLIKNILSLPSPVGHDLIYTQIDNRVSWVSRIRLLVFSPSLRLPKDIKVGYSPVIGGGHDVAHSRSGRSLILMRK